jgi:hypothetical protein
MQTIGKKMLGEKLSKTKKGRSKFLDSESLINHNPVKGKDTYHEIYQVKTAELQRQEKILNNRSNRYCPHHKDNL